MHGAKERGETNKNACFSGAFFKAGPFREALDLRNEESNFQNSPSFGSKPMISTKVVDEKIKIKMKD